MTIKNSALMLAIATVLAAGVTSLSARADAPLASSKVATTAPMPTNDDAAERAERAAKEDTEEHHDVAVANRMSKDQIIDQLKAAGYTDIDRVDFEHGVWRAKATDSTGKEVKLKLDAVDGHVISRKKD